MEKVRYAMADFLETQLYTSKNSTWETACTFHDDDILVLLGHLLVLTMFGDL